EGSPFDLAVAPLPAAAGVNDLPVAAGHVVLARVERAAAENADPPVKVGNDELLRNDQLRLRQHLFQLLAQLFAAGHLDHTAREGAVGLLEHARQADLLFDLIDVVVVHHHALRTGNAAHGEELGLVDLIRAAHDRSRIIDDDQALGNSAAGEAVRV